MQLPNMTQAQEDRWWDYWLAKLAYRYCRRHGKTIEQYEQRTRERLHVY